MLRESAPVVDRMCCLRKTGWSEDFPRAEVLDVVWSIGSDPVGAQILDLFKIDEVSAFDSSYLDSVNDLHGRYNDLRRQLESTIEPGGTE